MTFSVDSAVLERGSVQVDLHEHVLTVTLNRPEVRNAMTPAMWSALEAIGEGITPDVRVVVLKGAGVGFSAGLDRSMLTPAGPDAEESLVDILNGSDAEVADAIAVYQRGYLWLRKPEIITIAAVHGHCIGGGFQLALACDLRIAAEDASFSMREPKLGLVPDLTGTKPLVEAVGYSRALEMVVTARNVPASEALSIGLVQQVVPGAELDDAASTLARSLCQHPHGAVTGSKALLQQAVETPFAQQIRDERETQVGRLRELSALLGVS